MLKILIIQKYKRLFKQISTKLNKKKLLLR